MSTPWGSAGQAGHQLHITLTPQAAANLERAAADLGIPPEDLANQLAARVEVESAGRLRLAAEE